MIKKLYTLENDSRDDFVLLVTGVTDRGFTKVGDPYVSVELFDGAKKASVNYFGVDSEQLKEQGLEVGTIINISLTRKNGFYNLETWSVNYDPSISEKDFIHIAPIDIDACFDKIIKRLKELIPNLEKEGEYTSLVDLTLEILNKFEYEFKYSSAAVKMHHNYIGGLLYHTYRMLDMAYCASRVYPCIDEELLVCATVLHDIGKIKCYQTDDIGNSKITVEGRLLDHALDGILIIRDAAANNNYNPEKLQMLLHMIASHHGKKEWDAITTPAFPEAAILHNIDKIDSEINMFEEAYKGQERGTVSEDRVYGLENSSIYKPLYNIKWE